MLKKKNLFSSVSWAKKYNLAPQNFVELSVEIFWTVQVYRKTSRDRPKSAPYPRLKNSKKTSKCQGNVHQSVIKIRSRTKKGAIQNGRPDRSLKSRRKQMQEKETHPPDERRERDNAWWYETLLPRQFLASPNRN